MVSDIHVMGPAEGAAWRFQIEGMLGALAHLADRAEASGDQPVVDLLTALKSAHTAASAIEDRRPVLTSGKGVSLARR